MGPTISSAQARVQDAFVTEDFVQLFVALCEGQVHHEIRPIAIGTDVVPTLKRLRKVRFPEQTSPAERQRHGGDPAGEITIEEAETVACAHVV
jgi:hypothetical protein